MGNIYHPHRRLLWLWLTLWGLLFLVASSFCGRLTLGIWVFGLLVGVFLVGLLYLSLLYRTLSLTFTEDAVRLTGGVVFRTVKRLSIPALQGLLLQKDPLLGMLGLGVLVFRFPGYTVAFPGLPLQTAWEIMDAVLPQDCPPHFVSPEKKATP